MPAPTSSLEQRALRVSLLITFSLALVAIIWGLLANSQIILFDGVYALLGTALTAVSMAAARISRLSPTDRFPFGFEAVVPLAVGIQGAAMLGTIAYASLEAVRVILDGGSEVAAGSVAIYGALTAAACLGAWAYLRRADPTSDLLAAEAKSWWASMILSVVVLVGALLALGLRAAGISAVEPFIDPSLVLIASAILLPTPLGMLRTMVVEMLEGSPSSEIRDLVVAATDAARTRFDLPEPTLRLSKLGRKLYVEADFVVDSGWSVADEDEVRRHVREALSDLPYDVWLNVELTTDPELLA